MMLRIFTQMRSGFARSVALVAGGALISQGLIVAVTPVLTRLFSPESFGVLTAFTSVLTILVALASLKYELAIPQVRMDKHAQELTVLSLYVLVLISFLSLFVLVVVWAFASQALPIYAWFIPVGLLFSGGFQIANYRAIRDKNFLALTLANIQRSVVQALLQVIAGLASMSGVFLIVGYVVSQGAAGLHILVRAFRGQKAPSISRALVLARMYKKFPIIAAPAALLNAAAMNISPFLIIYFFGLHEAGLFALAQRAMGAPMAFLGTAIANVYLSEIPKFVQASGDQALVFYKKALRNLILLGLPIVAGAALVLFFSVEFVFGSAWGEASFIIIVLAPLFFGQFVVSPLSQTLNVIERQDIQLKWDLLRLCLPNIGLVLVAVSGAGFVLALLLFSMLMFFVYLINVFVTLKVLKHRQAIRLRGGEV